MPRRYTAYLLRHWDLGDGRERVEVQLLPSGEAHRCASLPDAYAWLTQQRARPQPHLPPGDAPGDATARPQDVQSPPAKANPREGGTR